MRRDEVLALIKAHYSELQERFGVKSIGIFGSVARDEAGTVSDVDILVEFARPVGLFTFAALQRRLESILGTEVDLATPDALKRQLKDRILKELVRAD